MCNVLVINLFYCSKCYSSNLCCYCSAIVTSPPSCMVLPLLFKFLKKKNVVQLCHVESGHKLFTSSPPVFAQILIFRPAFSWIFSMSTFGSHQSNPWYLFLCPQFLLGGSWEIFFFTVPQSELSRAKFGLPGGHTISYPLPVYLPLDLSCQDILQLGHHNVLIFVDDNAFLNCGVTYNTCIEVHILKHIQCVILNPSYLLWSTFHPLRWGLTKYYVDLHNCAFIT